MTDSSLKLYRVAEIRTAERIAIQNLGIPGLQLMRTAGLAAFNVLRRRWPEQRRLQVFCGGGNNGGDGYILARLAMQAGFEVKLYSLADVLTLTGDAMISFRDFVQAGGQVLDYGGHTPRDAVVVDAMLGIGLSRTVTTEYADAIQAINVSGCLVLAIDVPSGLHADTGTVMGCAVKADLVATFIAMKCGLFTGQAAEYCGKIVCDNLGIPDSVFANLPVAAELIQKTPLPLRPRAAHKGHFGHVLLIGGNLGFSGAIRLAGEAALRCGAGLVTIATHPAHSTVLNIGRPELMVHGVDRADTLQPLLAKATVVVIGPGLGQDDWARRLVSAVHAVKDIPSVFDADALNLLAESPGQNSNRILTPHPGEAARLLGCSNASIGNDRYAAVWELQRRYGGVCVLKGAGTLISDGLGCCVCTAGNPGMASGGMGDILAGQIGGLLAQGLWLLDAAKLAVQVHGEAADALAATAGERGMLASDLLPKIRELLN